MIFLDAERNIAQYYGFAVPAAQIGNVEDGRAHGASS
jgi:hypothetical protein